jgi:hypothetical protein
MVVLSSTTKNVFKEIDIPFDIQEIIDKVYIKYQDYYPESKITFHYINDKNFIEPAAYLNNKVYINSSYKFSPIFLEGIIAHELGHAKSNLVKYRWIHAFRVSSILSRRIYMFRYQKRNFFSTTIGKLLDPLFWLIYNIFSLLDHFAINPFFNDDELYANKIAVDIGFGDSLRYFYYNSFINMNDEAKTIKKYYDFRHPSAKKMLDRIEEQMMLDHSEIDVFAVHNRIYKVRNAKNNKVRNQKIMKWYEYKASKNIDSIFYDLGQIYETGKYEVDISNETAISYYSKAKELNYSPAIYRLILLQYKIGIEDEKMFYKDVSKLCKDKFTKAYIYLAYCYAYGIGTEIDDLKADKYFILAANEKDSNGLRYKSVINQEFIYSSHTNKEVQIKSHKILFNSINEILIKYDDEVFKCRGVFETNQLVLFKDDEKYGILSIKGDMITLKHFKVISDSQEHIISIVYIKEKKSQ